jgi:predicted RNase H-like HicB family nuclease
MEQLEDGQVLMADELLNCYGVGDSPEEAVEDLALMLVEHQADLAKSHNKLSAYLRRQLRMLDYFLGPRC